MTMPFFSMSTQDLYLHTERRTFLYEIVISQCSCVRTRQSNEKKSGRAKIGLISKIGRTKIGRNTKEIGRYGVRVRV